MEDLMCAVLRGEDVGWPCGNDPATIESFLSRCGYHGLQSLLLERLTGSNWPPPLVDKLREHAVGHAIWELGHQRTLVKLIPELAKAETQPILIKGTALAYSLYDKPALRIRADSDVLIPADADSRSRAISVLATQGFIRDAGVTGELVSYQASFSRFDDRGGRHTIDLHWRINNSELLSRLFSYEELRARSLPSPALGQHALAPSTIDSLLLACIHRATHRQNPYYVGGVRHYGGDRFIWVYDIHLLSGTLSAEQWSELLLLADAKGLRSICRDGFQQACRRFHTPVPRYVLETLSRKGALEPVADYLGSGALRQQWMDFRAIPGPNLRLRFIGEVLFPSTDYMRWKYPQARPSWLPWLYVRRAFRGLFTRIVRSVSPRPVKTG